MICTMRIARQAPVCSSRVSRSLLRSIATEISPTTTLLRAVERDNEVYLVGTAHTSEKSAHDIEELIELVRPDKVFVELDESRAAKMIKDDPDPFQSRMISAFENMSKSVPGPLLGASRSGDTNFFRSFYEKLKQHGLLPGIDMKSAMLAAQRANAEIVYGDRSGDETMREIIKAINPSVIMKAVGHPIPFEIQNAFSESGSPSGLAGFAPAVEKMKSREFARLALNWMDEATPEIASAIVHQRDRIMANNLRKYCGSGKIVAVVGIIHLEGVQREWLKLQPGILQE